MVTEDPTDYGQISIFNKYFPSNEYTTPKLSPTKCIMTKESYCCVNKTNKKEIPIMIGSDIDLDANFNDNPVSIKGYFIVQGECKAINNVMVDLKPLYTNDIAILPNNTVLYIHSMGKYYNYPKFSTDKTNKRYKWKLPSNYMDLCKACTSKKKYTQLATHLNSVVNYWPETGPQCNDPLTLTIISKLFTSWIENNPVVSEWRIITPGESIFKQIHSNKNIKQNNVQVTTHKVKDIIQCMTTNIWDIGHSSFPISENMHFYNIIHDIEAIRRITILGDRNHTSKERRYIRDNFINLICPVQTSSGPLTGTVMYLAKDAKIKDISNSDKIELNTQDDIFFFNGTWYGTSKDGVKSIFKSSKYNKLKLINGKEVYIMWPDIGTLYTSKDTKDKYIDSRMLSYTPSHIPYFNFNPPVRAMFTCSMIKQAISVDNRPIKNIRGGNSLIEGEQPLIGPNMPSILGNNLICAIMPWYGYNVEDAIVISKSAANKFKSIEKIVITKEYECILEIYKEKHKQVKNNEIICTILNNGEIEHIKAKFNDNNPLSEKGEIKEISTHTLENSTRKILFIRIEVDHKLEEGDKMASRHGQKGVVSKIEDDSNMPYFYIHNNKYIVEILINPHAFPSRMTMGQVEEIKQTGGYKELCIERMDNSIITIHNKILTGKCFYMALRHQVNNKVQYRHIGNNDILTMQPIGSEGLKDSGLRFGQMERDILLSTGQINILKNYWESDKENAYVCNICGTIYSVQQYENNKNKQVKSSEKDCDCTINKVCLELVKTTKSLLITLSCMRSNLLEIKWKVKEKKYSIIRIDTSYFTSINIDKDSLHYGLNDVLEIKAFGACPLLPVCMRTPQIDAIYNKFPPKTPKAIGIIMHAHAKLLEGKTGIFHRLVEGHQLNNTLRSVIIPNPKLPPNTIAIPNKANIGCSGGILNRQPTLSTDSFMYVNIVKSDTNCIEINPRICDRFNADFDGDEMVIYGLNDSQTINKAETTFIPTIVNAQDYKYAEYYEISLNEVTENGLTISKQDALKMIEAKSKGSMQNIKHIYEEIGDIYYEGKIIWRTKCCYSKGLDTESWYAGAKAAREAAVSISINTPYTGNLYAKIMNNLL